MKKIQLFQPSPPFEDQKKNIIGEITKKIELYFDVNQQKRKKKRKIEISQSYSTISQKMKKYFKDIFRYGCSALRSNVFSGNFFDDDDSPTGIFTNQLEAIEDIFQSLHSIEVEVLISKSIQKIGDNFFERNYLDQELQEFFAFANNLCKNYLNDLLTTVLDNQKPAYREMNRILISFGIIRIEKQLKTAKEMYERLHECIDSLLDRKDSNEEENEEENEKENEKENEEENEEENEKENEEELKKQSAQENFDEFEPLFQLIFDAKQEAESLVFPYAHYLFSSLKQSQYDLPNYFNTKSDEIMNIYQDSQIYKENFANFFQRCFKTENDLLIKNMLKTWKEAASDANPSKNIQNQDFIDENENDDDDDENYQQRRRKDMFNVGASLCDQIQNLKNIISAEQISNVYKLSIEYGDATTTKVIQFDTYEKIKQELSGIYDPRDDGENSTGKILDFLKEYDSPIELEISKERVQLYQNQMLQKNLDLESQLISLTNALQFASSAYFERIVSLRQNKDKKEKKINQPKKKINSINDENDSVTSKIHKIKNKNDSELNEYDEYGSELNKSDEYEEEDENDENEEIDENDEIDENEELEEEGNKYNQMQEELIDTMHLFCSEIENRINESFEEGFQEYEEKCYMDSQSVNPQTGKQQDFMKKSKAQIASKNERLQMIPKFFPMRQALTICLFDAQCRGLEILTKLKRNSLVLSLRELDWPRASEIIEGNEGLSQCKAKLVNVLNFLQKVAQKVHVYHLAEEAAIKLENMGQIESTAIMDCLCETLRETVRRTIASYRFNIQEIKDHSSAYLYQISLDLDKQYDLIQTKKHIPERLLLEKKLLLDLKHLETQIENQKPNLGLLANSEDFQRAKAEYKTFKAAQDKILEAIRDPTKRKENPNTRALERQYDQKRKELEKLQINDLNRIIKNYTEKKEFELHQKREKILAQKTLLKASLQGTLFRNQQFAAEILKSNEKTQKTKQIIKSASLRLEKECKKVLKENNLEFLLDPSNNRRY